MYNYLPDPNTKEFLDAVLRLAHLAEYREGNNQRHLERVSKYCHLLGEGIDLPAQEVDVIAAASQLHDIGKISIPDRMLNKAENLNPDEWEIIKSHTTIGASLLHGTPSRIMQQGEIIALGHHERWNGSGYPKGHTEEDIPVSARIVAIADVFDALTTKRPYKDEISAEEAKALILDYRGELFDPKIVDIFEKRFSEIKRIREKIS
ncbi:MAG: HD domain-containing protein [Anaerolineae bacterium]|nr:HD domain-containing protein [Anaerolineae bacterium]